MSHFVEFSVDALAGRTKKYAVALHRDVNIFFGQNGSGKTSLLKILHSAMGFDSSILKNVPFTNAQVKLFSLSYDMILTRSIAQLAIPEVKSPETETHETDTIFYTLGASAARHVASGSIEWSTSPAKPKTAGFAHSYLPISRLYSGFVEQASLVSGNVWSQQVSLSSGYSEEDLDRRFASSIRQLWRSYSADVSKAVREAQQKGLANIVRAVLSQTGKPGREKRGPSTKRAYQRVASFLAREPGFSDVLGSEAQFSAKYSKDANLRNVVKDIEEVEKRIEAATAPRERLREMVNSMYVGGKAVEFGENDIQVRLADHKSIALPLLSSGEKQLLYILVSTLVAGSNAILIDEPEISMHVDWQRKLVQAMKLMNPEAQIILATHSPEIMAEVPDNNIFRL